MTTSESTERLSTTERAIRAWLGERFVPIALRGLPRMVDASGDVFCFAAFAGERPDALRLGGISQRYTAMSLLGLARQRELGRTADLPQYAALTERMARFALDCPEVGDVGLVLWLHVLHGDARAEELAARALARRDEVFSTRFPGASMELGNLLLGLSEAIRAGIGDVSLKAFATRVASLLKGNQDPASGLFSFSRRLTRKNLLRARVDGRLGSFASQVYPTMGFAAHARATGDERSLAACRASADAIARLQGPEGQWWWIYHPQQGHAALRYPVYAVHQDGMGPMALAAAALADGAHDRYDAAILKSLTWFDERPECRGQELIDAARGVVWRAVQHDDPATTGRLGLGAAELRRMGMAAWFGSEDRRGLDGGFVCPECRPYHLGWILLADALCEELFARRQVGEPG